MNPIFGSPSEDFTGRKAHEALAQANFIIPYNKEFEAYFKKLRAEFREAVEEKRVGKLLKQYPLPKAVEDKDIAPEEEEPTAEEVKTNVFNFLREGEETTSTKDVLNHLKEKQGMSFKHRKSEIKHYIEDFVNSKKISIEEEEKEEGILSPIENGLIGLYTADSLTEKSWIDLSGHNNDAENIGSYKEYISFGNNRDNEVVKGNPGSKIIFPPSILPEIYTLVSVARYTDTQKGRIFDGMTKNWLSGFWGEGTNFYHEGWVSSMNGNGNPGNKWIINIDTGDSVWSNGKDITSNSNLTTSDRLTINAGFHQKESSSFEVAYVAVYDRRLTRSEIKEYTEWLSESFNITI